MEDATIPPRLAVPAVLWSEVPDLLKGGHEIELVRHQKFSDQPNFACILTDPESRRKKVIINKNSNKVEPEYVNAINLLLAIGTYSDEPNFTLPLQPKAPGKRTVVATLSHKVPKPDLKWSVDVDGEYYMGERKPVATLNINRALENGIILGATEALVPIGEPLRKHFRAREFRIRALEKAVAPGRLYSWSKTLDLPHKLFEKVVNRGDDHPAWRQAIIEKTGLNEATLWPEIDWGK